LPFADKFRAMMDFPFAGDCVAGFVVEHVDVAHESGGAGRYVYPIRIVLRGPGGQAGVKRALKTMLPPHTMTFSAYGNAYQLWFGKPEIESLGDGRYAVTVEGAGARVHLDDELERFVAFLAEEGHLAAGSEGEAAGPLVRTYLEGYQGEIKRKVARYRRRLRKA
jgi:hypothetical protein